DLIITDWMMPEMSGVELTRIIKNDPQLSSIPIIMLTAKGGEDNRREAIGFGADGYLGKPFDQNELISLANNLINLKKGEKHIAQLNRDLSDRVLRRFLPPQLVRDIIEGKAVFDTKAKNTMITLLILSICDFRKTLAALGPNYTSSILDEYFSEMSAIAFRHNGVVDRFEDGTVRIIFGAFPPDQPELQSRLAVLCAFDMKSALSGMREKWKKQYDHHFEFKIAIHSGEAIVGNFGSPLRSDYTAIGNAVIITKNIEAVASAGEILISGRARDFLPKGKWESRGRHKFEGFEDEVLLFNLLEMGENEVRAA
ncbi:MAG: response regulator, partial [Oligoflexales bacterium]|nr:response regulator [Oligoflexales bacterium]